MKKKTLDIKKLRQKLALTQVEFAALVGVDPITISRWERGLAEPSKLALRELRSIQTGGRDPAKN